MNQEEIEHFAEVLAPLVEKVCDQLFDICTHLNDIRKDHEEQTRQLASLNESVASIARHHGGV